MIKLTFICLVLPALAWADALTKQLKEVSSFLSNPNPGAEYCPDEKVFGTSTRPKIKKGEAKVSFDCKDYPTPTETSTNILEIEKETISFYRQDPAKDQEDLGIVARTRVDAKGKSDTTVKFRPKSNELLLIDPDAQKDLAGLAKTDGELKCEADVSYGTEVEVEEFDKTANTMVKVKKRSEPNNAESCSFTAAGSSPTANHGKFLAAVGAGSLLKNGEFSLAGLKRSDIQATSWKDQSLKFQGKPFAFERWDMGGQCIFEVSVKFEVKEDKTITDEKKRAETLAAALKQAYEDGIQAILQEGQKQGKVPTAIQGNKTKRALKALDDFEQAKK